MALLSRLISSLLVVALTACGGGGNEDVLINSPPIADAGAAQNVTAGAVVTLNGSASTDANSDPLTYSWTLASKPNGSIAALAGTTSVAPTFTADLAGTYVASLVVNDGNVNSTASTVMVTATLANAAPVANAGAAQNVTAGAVVTLNGSASTDANSDPLTYSWTLTSKPTGSVAALAETTSVAPTFTADLAGTYVASLVVSDGKVNSTASTVMVTSTVANAAPVASAGAGQNVTAGAVVTLNGSASTDANSDPLTYSWTLTSKPTGSVAALAETTSVAPTFTADLAGTYVASLVVSDGKVNSTASTVMVTSTVANAAPVASAGAGQNVTAGAVVTLNGSASTDANSDPLTYSWTLTSKPTGSVAALAETTSVAPTFTADLAGTYVASLVVSDGKVNSTASTVMVTSTVANAAPVASAGAGQNVTAGAVVTLNGSASTDANSDPLTYSWTLTSKPTGSVAALAETTSVAPTFTADLAGTYVASLVVSDGKVNSTASTVMVTSTLPGGGTTPDPSLPNELLNVIAAAPENSWINANINTFDSQWPPEDFRALWAGGPPSDATAIIRAWASFAWDDKRHRLIIFGGGHANSSDNSVYSWSAHTRRWQLAFWPTDVRIVAGGQGEETVDGPLHSPMSAHTYNNQQYLPVLDRFFSMGGATQSSGYPWQTTAPYDPPARPIGAMTLDMTLAGQGYVGGLSGTNPHRGASLNVNLPGAQAWAARDWYLDHADPNGALPGMEQRLNSHTAYRTEGGHDVVYFKSNIWNLTRIEMVDGDYRNDIITRVGLSANYSYVGSEQGSALDTGMDIFLAMGWYDKPFVGWNLKTAGPFNFNFVVPTGNLIGSGAAEFTADIRASMTFGLLFDERRDYFVLWSRGGRTYALRRPVDLNNLSTGWQVTRMSDDTASPRPATLSEMAVWNSYRRDTGVSGKWKRAKTLDVYIGIQDGVNGSIWIYKPANWVDPRN